MKTYSLAEVASIALPEEWTDGVRWLARRLNRGEIRGYRVGRVWRMTQEHLDWLLEHFSNDTQALKVAPGSPKLLPGPIAVVDGLSPRGRARRRSSDAALPDRRFA
ncbi:hypothetical protein ABW16_21370 [Mycolicibacter heraklionensis]|uniref:DNA-binding protein n=1 Tax=Mycolicibacter heraklionensis TaxID=512402 RepID=A0ABR5F9Z8_9MYCO|nr:hypothetical protein ABW16_21370 [Mycolicibacter heraklionensis]